MFGGTQINGLDTDNIYKCLEDLTIAGPSIKNIILKTNCSHLRTMRFNPYVTSMNTSLYLTSFKTFNNAAICTSSLNISGMITFTILQHHHHHASLLKSSIKQVVCSGA